MTTTRREYIKKSAAGSAAIAIGGVLPGFSARSYNQILGANERVRLSFIGVNSRGNSLASNFSKLATCEAIHVCDVDSRAILKCSSTIEKITGKKPLGFKDFRLSLESRDVDAVVIATPDNWHAPAAMLALKAGKHVYLEKPCSYAPAEGEMLVHGAKKYNKVMQMGNQRRSWPNIVQGIQALKDGVIGRVYYAKGWYANNRPSIGIGKECAVPEWLDWDLWQGPATRKPFKDNYVHYNWHWFWHWGTGEALNNGTHMVDLMRWGLGAEFPTMVNSAGGRFRYQDDWQTPDTQIISMEFPNNTALTWEGRSCNPHQNEGASVGVTFYGEKGTLVTQGGNDYTIYGLDEKIIKKAVSEVKVDSSNLMNPGEKLDALHLQNFFDGITKGVELHSDIVGGHNSTLLVQLGNISQRVGRSLKINPQNGHILHDHEASKFWSREYEKGWEMTL
jgi:predicted dehydrogenase